MAQFPSAWKIFASWVSIWDEEISRWLICSTDSLFWGQEYGKRIFAKRKKKSLKVSRKYWWENLQCRKPRYAVGNVSNTYTSSKSWLRLFLQPLQKWPSWHKRALGSYNQTALGFRLLLHTSDAWAWTSGIYLTLTYAQPRSAGVLTCGDDPWPAQVRATSFCPLGGQSWGAFHKDF